jgi:hypothetical protein
MNNRRVPVRFGGKSESFNILNDVIGDPFFADSLPNTLAFLLLFFLSLTFWAQ